MDKKLTDFEKIFIICSGGIFLVLSIFTYGFTLHKLWVWFMVQSVFALPDISIGECLGIRLIIDIATYNSKDCVQTERKELSDIFAASLCNTVLIPAMALLFGYIYSHYSLGGLLK